MRKTSSLTSFLSRKDKMKFFWRRIELFSPFWFSHHPQCENFSSEIIKVGRYRLCRGCTVVYLLALVTSIFVIFFQMFRDFFLGDLVILALVISSPTWIGVFFNFKRRWIKDIIRASLGVGWGIALGSLVVRPSLVEKLVIILLMGMFYQAFKWSRRIKHQHVDALLCSNCRQLSDNACKGTKQLLDAERIFSRELSDFLQKKIRETQGLLPFFFNEKKEKEDVNMK